MINKIAKRDIFTNIRVDVTSEKFKTYKLHGILIFKNEF